MSDEFVNLHTHSHSSAFDGLGAEEAFARRAADLGQPAIAFTEHGSIRGLYEAHKATQAAGVRLIPGCELYLADDAEARGLSPAQREAIHRANPDADARKAALAQAEARVRDRDHVTVWALDDVGVRNLYRLTTWAWTRGFYYKPRVDLARLEEFGEGLAVSSGCPTGLISSPLRAGRFEEAIDRAERLADSFGDRFYFEIMPHAIPESPGLAGRLVRLADRVGARIVATQDAHYPEEGDSVAQEALLCIQTRARMSDPNRFKFSTREFWLRSRAEMEFAFARNCPEVSTRVVQNALDETVRFSERVSARVPLAKVGAYLVAPQIPTGVGGYDDWIAALCREGVRDRFGMDVGDLGEDYLERLVYELRTISDLGFSAYFAAVWDVRRFAREAGIFAGPGRGSAAGSLVAYLLRITDLDPIRHGLMFERFLAPGRRDLPDVDLDFDADRRDEIVDYLRDTYGEDRTSRISTRINLGGKQTLHDLARIYGIPDREVVPVAGLITQGQSEEEQTDDSLAEVLAETDAGRAFASRYPDIAAVGVRLEGNLRTTGIHPAGIVISSIPIADVAPIETAARKGGPRVPVVAFSMEAVEAAGLVKIDVLSLRNLTMIRRACDIAGISPDDIDLEDAETLQAFSDHRFVGVFQFGSPAARQAARGFQFQRFLDVAAITALNRPGPAKTGLAAEFVRRAADPSRIVSVHPVVDATFAETLGVPVYQEQVVRLVRDLCGYSPEDADKFRKKVSKKKGLSDERPRFVAGAIAAGMTEDEAEALFDSLVGFASYAFNKAHAVCYAALAVWTMFLKVHHPEAFFSAYLATEPKTEQQLRIAAEARRMGIKVAPPDVNASEGKFALAHEADGTPVIVAPVADLKGVGAGTAERIAQGRPYADLLDFHRRAQAAGARLNVRTFEILARGTALRALCPNTRLLVENARSIWAALVAGIRPTFEATSAFPDYKADEIATIAGEVYPLFVDLQGNSAFDVIEARVRAICSRTIALPSDVPEAEGAALILGRLSQFRTFPGDKGGGKVGRIRLTSPDGSESTVRVDDDVLDANARVLASTGKPVLAAVHVGREGRLSLEGIWTAESLLQGPRDPIAEFLISPGKTRPRDPRRALLATEEDGTFVIEGMILRVRRGEDKTGGRMFAVGLLGERGFVRFYVFASRMRADVKALVPGAQVRVALRRMRGEGCCLGDRDVEIRDLSDNVASNP